MPLWVLLTVLIVLALAAPRYGVDSRKLRPGEGPHRRGPTPLSDAAALVAFLRHVEWTVVRPERTPPLTR